MVHCKFQAFDYPGDDLVLIQLWDDVKGPDDLLQLRIAISRPAVLPQLVDWLSRHVPDPAAWLAENMPWIIDAHARYALEKS